MKRNKILSILLLLVLLLFPKVSFASSFKSINIHAYIDENGRGHISEDWDVNEKESKATEKYKAMPDLGEIQIRDFSVRQGDKYYEEMDPWQEDASFEEKAGRYGMLDVNDGVELVWGISQFGKNTYSLKYTIDPLVVSLNDYDMVHFRFVGEEFNPKPESIYITIETKIPMPEDVSMWAFGFEGDINREGDSIIARSTGKVNYGHIMLRFPKGTFNSAYAINDNFESFANEAVKGSDWEGDSNSFAPVFGFILSIIMVGFVTIATAIGIENSRKYKIHNEKLLKKKKHFKEQYFREIPYPGPIEDTYLLATKAYNDISIANYLNAFMLKWVYEGVIEFGEDEVDRLFTSKKEPYVKIIHAPAHPTEVEAAYFDIIKQSVRYSDDDKIYQKHVEKYMKKNKEEVEKLYEKFPAHSLDALETSGYIDNVKKKKRFSSKDPYKNHITVTDKGISLYENFIKFKNYLKDYSLIRERGVNEVHLWDQFMIYAAIYGISAEVYKNFEAIYPEYTNTSFYNYYMITNMNNYSKGIATTAANLGNFEAAGSGGAASFGGGGGGFGGGGGGGSR